MFHLLPVGQSPIVQSLVYSVATDVSYTDSDRFRCQEISTEISSRAKRLEIYAAQRYRSLLYMDSLHREERRENERGQTA